MPYHTPGVANGLAFSNGRPDFMPPSLRNIFKEMSDDIGEGKCDWGLPLAQQGVLLLNTALTVEEGKPGSHDKLWEAFTNFTLKQLNESTEKIIFVLWGQHAQSYKSLIDDEKHFIIESAHPSPLSATKGFFGSKPFSKINSIISALNKTEIKWLTQ